MIATKVNFSEVPELPFLGAQHTKTSSQYENVDLIIKEGEIYLNGQKVCLFLFDEQKEGSVSGPWLYIELEEKGENISAKLIDFFVRYPELYPEGLKEERNGSTVKIFCWGDLFQNSLHGDNYVRYMCWDNEKKKVISDYYNDDEDYWGPDDLSALFPY